MSDTEGEFKTHGEYTSSVVGSYGRDSPLVIFVHTGLVRSHEEWVGDGGVQILADKVPVWQDRWFVGERIRDVVRLECAHAMRKVCRVDRPERVRHGEVVVRSVGVNLRNGIPEFGSQVFHSSRFVILDIVIVAVYRQLALAL